MVKVVLRGVIPTAQYANLQPEIEAEAETYDEAMALAEGRMADFWNRHVEGDKKLPVQSGVKLAAFVGGEIFYDELTHTYRNESGETYLSGSQHAKKFEKPFDKQNIALKMAGKYKVTPDEIINMWELKARTSREFGTALHSALQLYGQYNGLAKALERDTAMHDHPTIKSIVQGFYEGRDGEKAEYEVLVVDHTNKRAGQIDRLLITGDKTCRVQDYKFNADMTPDKLKVYWQQLKFYGEIMAANGWKTEPPEIFHYDNQWHVIKEK